MTVLTDWRFWVAILVLAGIITAIVLLTKKNSPPPDCNTDADCLNSGKCLPDKTCSCIGSYYGKNCTKKKCPNDCSGNGSCSNDGVCTCNPNWLTEDCSVTCTKEGNECVYGECVDGKCRCDAPGVSGVLCDKLQCENNCNNHGTCVLSDDKKSTQCKCSSPWHGDYCELYCNDDNDCKNGGNCISGMCQCKSPYSGVDCSIEGCDEKNCNLNGGKCDNQGNCNCFDEENHPEDKGKGSWKTIAGDTIRCNNCAEEGDPILNSSGEVPDKKYKYTWGPNTEKKCKKKLIVNNPDNKYNLISTCKAYYWGSWNNHTQSEMDNECQEYFGANSISYANNGPNEQFKNKHNCNLNTKNRQENNCPDFQSKYSCHVPKYWADPTWNENSQLTESCNISIENKGQRPGYPDGFEKYNE